MINESTGAFRGSASEKNLLQEHINTLDNERFVFIIAVNCLLPSYTVETRIKEPSYVSRRQPVMIFMIYDFHDI